jgi:hypothetical protein
MNTVTYIETDFGSVTISGELHNGLEAIVFETRKQDRRKRGVKEKQRKAHEKMDEFTNAVGELMRVCYKNGICEQIHMQ